MIIVIIVVKMLILPSLGSALNAKIGFAKIIFHQFQIPIQCLTFRLIYVTKIKVDQVFSAVTPHFLIPRKPRTEEPSGFLFRLHSAGMNGT